MHKGCSSGPRCACLVDEDLGDLLAPGPHIRVDAAGGLNAIIQVSHSDWVRDCFVDGWVRGRDFWWNE